MKTKPMFRRVWAASSACLLLIMACSLFSAPTPTSEPPAPPPVEAPPATTEPPPPPPTEALPTEPPPPSPTETSESLQCYLWSEVTTSMIGEEVCAKGVITSLNKSNKVSTRYEFSDKPNTFFLYSANYEYYDSKTGKTFGPDFCVFILGEVESQGGVPAMDLDAAFAKENLVFTAEIAECE